MKSISWVGSRTFLLFLLFFAVAGSNGCAPALSKQLRDEAGKPVLFEDLQQRADEYKDRIVILGGYILETVNEADGSVLKILQAPLDSRNRPKSSDLSKGRFLVLAGEFLDPAVYSEGRKVAIGGRVVGVQKRKLSNRMYEYPIIEAQEMHLWPKEPKYGRPYYPYYDPWYHPYPYRYRYPYW